MRLHIDYIHTSVKLDSQFSNEGCLSKIFPVSNNFENKFELVFLLFILEIQRITHLN